MTARTYQFSLPVRILLGAVIVLALVVIGELLWLKNGDLASNRVDEPDVPLVDAAAAVIDGANMPKLPPLSAFSEIVDRPVFTSTRRPQPTGAKSDASTLRANKMRQTWKLTGVVMSKDAHYVLIEGKKDRRTVQLEYGAVLDGWRLEEIVTDEIVLVSGEERLIFELHDNSEKSR